MVVNDAEDRRGGPSAANLPCGSCGMPLGATAKFCSECGKPVSEAASSAEYKQVTVLFADVVHSMDRAATVGAERLREIMVDLAGRCTRLELCGDTAALSTSSPATASWRFSARRGRWKTMRFVPVWRHWVFRRMSGS